MQQILKAIEREIAKIEKLYNAASRRMDNFREMKFADMTTQDHKDYSAAIDQFGASDKKLTALYVAKEKIESVIKL